MNMQTRLLETFVADNKERPTEESETKPEIGFEPVKKDPQEMPPDTDGVDSEDFIAGVRMAAVEHWLCDVARPKLRDLTDDKATEWLALLKVGLDAREPPREIVAKMIAAALIDLMGYGDPAMDEQVECFADAEAVEGWEYRATIDRPGPGAIVSHRCRNQSLDCGGWYDMTPDDVVNACHFLDSKKGI